MCQSLAQGGQRCAAHTRPRYQTAAFGTPAWDEAAAAYASTPTGRMELQTSLAAAEAAGDVRSAVAFEHALAEGQRIREKAELFREELAHRTTPAPEPVAAALSYVHDLEDDGRYGDPDGWGTDDEYGDEFGGYSFTDEEAWETSPDRDWSPTMATQRWNEHDPVFRGCENSMTSNEFINQVCDNVGVTRAEFEAAAATYFAGHPVPLASPYDTDRIVGTPTFGVALEPDQLRSAVVAYAQPHYTPAQIKAIAELARDQRTTAPAATTPEASTGTGAARRTTRRSLPEVPDDPAALSALAEGNDALIREAVAGHANTPTEVLTRLATADAKIEVRAAAARNENLPVETLTGLVADRSIKVRAGAARNPSMPTAHLTALAEDANDNVKGAVARNPSTPAPLYEQLSAHESATVRKHAARRADIPHEIALRLAADGDQQVRSTLARNRTTQPGILRAMTADTEQSVRAAAAKNPNLPPALLRGRLSRDPAPGVRAAVARNENTSTAVLTRLSSDTDPWVRRNVAWNQNTPAVLLYALTHDPDEGVRTSARNRNTENNDRAAS